ncbi:unnamed protein product [Ixodes persulcatus]
MRRKKLIVRAVSTLARGATVKIKCATLLAANTTSAHFRILLLNSVGEHESLSLTLKN